MSHFASFRPLWKAALLPLVVLSGLSCGPGKPGQGKSLTLAVIPKGTTHEFWKSIHAGALKAGKELGVEIIWKGPLKEDDREGQISVVEDFVSRGVSGIVLAPLDDAALRAPVAQAKAAGIPTLIIDSGLQGNDFVGYVATDNKAAGALAGKKLAELLGGKGKVALLRYQEGSASTTQREAGFLEALSAFSGIQVKRENQYGGATTESAYKASENLLAPFKNPKGGLDLDGLFCPNESTTFGMLRALEDAGLAGKVRFVGFDASEKLVAALKEGKIQGLVVQDPMKMGYLGVKTLVTRLRGGQTEAVIDTGAALVTGSNMEEPAMKALLHPPLEEWLSQP